MMKNLLFKTGNEWSGLIARLILAIVFFPHGAQKMLGLFGGYGFSGTMQYFTETLHLPWILGFLVIVTEFFGSLFLLIGLAGRIWSSAIIMLMLGVIFMVHLPNGFFMNWFGNLKGEGYEYHLLAIGLALIVLVGGSGKYSLDRKITA